MDIKFKDQKYKIADSKNLEIATKFVDLFYEKTGMAKNILKAWQILHAIPFSCIQDHENRENAEDSQSTNTKQLPFN